MFSKLFFSTQVDFQHIFIYLFIFAACTELWQGSGIGLVIGRSFYEEIVEGEMGLTGVEMTAGGVTIVLQKVEWD